MVIRIAAFLRSLTFVSALIFPRALFADAVPVQRTLLLDQRVQVDFEPSQVLFFLRGPRSELKMQDGIVFGASNEKESAEASRVLYAGAVVSLPLEQRKVQYAILLRAKDGRGKIVPWRSLDVESKDLFSGSTDQLRAHLLQRKEALKSLEIQSRTQDESLERLRADAETIANVGRIVEVQEESERIDSQMRELDKDLENIKDFIRLAKQQPAPSNFSGREAQLTKQIRDLADAAKQAEGQEITRKSSSVNDIQRKLALVESTRFEDLDELQGELNSLRKKRAQLERGLGETEEKEHH